ncbi:MAG TPA: histidine phosphatase family protein [Thermoclostridium sp.]|nr:histidine phosphatase family protein [Thermoclostridium sp.]
MEHKPTQKNHPIVLLLRHGMTKGNMQRRYIGHTDEPLCEQGIVQAQAVGVIEDIAHVYASPMKRAIQTAKICFPNANLHIVKDLREMDFGDFEGRTADEMACDMAYRKWVDGNCEGKCPNGEDKASFQKRVQKAFDFVVHDAIERQLSKVAVIGHGGSIMSVMSKFAKSERAYYDWHVPNCYGYEIVIDTDVWEQSPHFVEYKYFERLK